MGREKRLVYSGEEFFIDLLFYHRGLRAMVAVELKRKYRELAKKNHPDALRAQGLPEEMIGKATERMSRINAAWATIREARGI